MGPALNLTAHPDHHETAEILADKANMLPGVQKLNDEISLGADSARMYVSIR